MTSSVINTYVSNTTETLSSSGDDLLVTSAGSIVNTNGAIGIDSAGSNQAITVDGLVYSADDGDGVGVQMTGESSSLFVNGQVEADLGIYVVNSSGDNVNIGAQGSVNGLDGTGVAFQGNISSPAVTGYTLGNAGIISAGFGFIAHAVEFQYGGDDLVINSGTISGAFGISYYDDTGTETIENTGTIEGGTGGITAAIESTLSTADVDIINSGLITDGAQNTIGSSYALIFFDDEAGTTSTIDNEGTITGAGYVIQSLSDTLDISNSGTIHGGIYLEGAGDLLINSGNIHGNVTMGTGDTLTNTGVIHGNVTFAGGTNTFDSSHGDVTGSVTGGSGNDVITGSIRDANTIFGGSAHDVLTGGNGDDVLNGGTGNDILTGGRGDDLLAGGGGTDTFKFSGNFGNDTITDFVAGSATGHGLINFAHNDFSSFSGVQAHMAQVGSDVVITFDATDSIVLQHVTLANLVSADFTFG